MIEDISYLQAERTRHDASWVIRAALEDLRDLDFNCRYSLTIRDTITFLEDAQESLRCQTHGVKRGISKQEDSE